MVKGEEAVALVSWSVHFLLGGLMVVAVEQGDFGVFSVIMA